MRWGRSLRPRAYAETGKDERVFVGQYEHALDDKGRVVLPSNFRASVAERGFVTRLDSCIGLWNETNFKAMAERWKAESEAGRISMRVFRKLMNSVREVKLDSAGRITLPRELLTELGFNAEAYADEQQSEEVSDELAEAVARLGL